METDVLIATDLLSEGLNLQDAARVVHYDLPWSPARLAQRVGRMRANRFVQRDDVEVTATQPRAFSFAFQSWSALCSET